MIFMDFFDKYVERFGNKYGAPGTGVEPADPLPYLPDPGPPSCNPNDALRDDGNSFPAPILPVDTI